MCANRSITLALDPQRDKDIDRVCKCIEAAGRAGMRGINYNFCVLSHQSTEPTVGRGGVVYRTFELDKYDNDTLSKAGCGLFCSCALGNHVVP